jgi:hypothetical protein
MNGYDINIASESDSSEVTKGQKPSASSPQSKTCEPNLFSSYNKDQPPINHWINNACITSLP